MRFVSPALKHLVFPALSRSGYLRHKAGSAPAVLTYHGVFPSGYTVRNPALDGNLVGANSLRNQLLLLKKHYHVITPVDFLHWTRGEQSLPPRSILLTCDDALQNNLTEMVPILQELGLSCVFFVTGASAEDISSMLWYEELYLMLLDAENTASIGIPAAKIRVDSIPAHERHTHWWNLVEQLSQFDPQLRHAFLCQIRDQLHLSDDWGMRLLENPALARRFLMLNRSGLRQLAAAGMSIGAHSLSHPILSRLSEDLAGQEITESRNILEKTLDQTIWAFAYPFGNSATVSQREFKLAERAGFQCAFMNDGGRLDVEGDLFAVPRVHVTANMRLAEFEAHISGFYHSLRKALIGKEAASA